MDRVEKKCLTPCDGRDITGGMATEKQTGTMAGILRRAFRDSGLSLNQLALRSGVPYMATHGYFNGKRDAMLTTVEKWSSVLGLELVPKRRKRKGGA